MSDNDNTQRNVMGHEEHDVYHVNVKDDDNANNNEDVKIFNVDTDSDDDKPHDGDNKHFTIKQDLFDALAENGFSENAIKKSIASGCVDYSTCLQWINMHKGHPELDTPLEDGVEVHIKAKRVLTEDERAAKVEELKDKIKLKKDQEKEEQHRKELERIEFGRKAVETKAMLEALRREQDLREVRREKQAEAEARRRVKIQIIADRYVRQGKSTEEAWVQAEAEFNAAAEKAREEAAARLAEFKATSSNNLLSKKSSENDSNNKDKNANTAAYHNKNSNSAQWDLSAVTKAAMHNSTTLLEELFAKPTPTVNDAHALVQAIKSNSNVTVRDACIQTLRLILTNIRDSPFDLKKRTLKTSTKTFVHKIMPIHEAIELLRLCHFDLYTENSSNDDNKNNNNVNKNSNEKSSSEAQVITCTTVVLRQINYIIDLLSE